MGQLEKEIEKLQEWACSKIKSDCYYCEYSIRDEVTGSACPFYEVIQAAKDKAKDNFAE